jgi:hypothetical protein
MKCSEVRRSSDRACPHAQKRSNLEIYRVNGMRWVCADLCA